ncbi:hypothetical protein AB0J81_26050 [Streptomyces bobili]|uniref:hypothetical protein n=1 Tax=Streptomyces bobili TaxID=67280 RepID=UPI0033D5B412
MRLRRARSCPLEPPRREAVGRRLSATAARCRRVLCDITRWLSRRRRIAADQFLRGACYGAGTAVVGLLALWLQTR